jgi:two-component system, cell cycle response regulator
MRLTSKVFLDLTIWMVGLGLAVGASFPLLAVALGVSGETAWSLRFVAACLGVGALVGAGSASVARVVVGARLRRFASRLQRARQDVVRGELAEAPEDDAREGRSLPPASDDAFGAGERALAGVIDAVAVVAQAQRADDAFAATLAAREVREAPERLAAEALTHYAGYAGALAGAILYESSGDLVLAASHGFADPASLRESEAVVAAARGAERRVLTSPGTVLVEDAAASFPPRTLLIDPIVDGGVRLGVMVLASRTAFDDAQRSRIDRFGRTFALALHATIARDRLNRLAAVDPLTGVLNRRFGLERLREEFGRAVRRTSPLGVLIFDVDHLDGVNHAYGQLVGDRVLRTVALITRAALRDGDVLSRIGGEEFLAVLPSAGAAELALIGERIRAVVANATLVEGTHGVRVTLSVGGAAYPDSPADSHEALQRLASGALHAAKRSGRDRVEIAR